MTALRQKMLDDLQLRNYSDRTIKAYLRCVSQFAQHFGKSPDQLGPAHIREYQLYLIKQKQCSWAVFNQTVCALRFFYNMTLGCKEMIEEIPYPRFEKRLPVVLSKTEVAALLQAVSNLKHRALLTTLYATGLRVSEVTNLVVTDIRVAISNQRLVALSEGQVTFRWKDYADGNAVKEMTLDVREFTRRFLLHILPRGFVRIRHYGLLANRCRRERLERCRKLLEHGVNEQSLARAVEVDNPCGTDLEPKTCPVCKRGRLIIVEKFEPQAIVSPTVIPACALDSS